MKYIIVVPDGMSDVPQDFPDGQTPMCMAETPTMDRLADTGKMFLTATVPEGMYPGSDVAGMSIFGADPQRCYTGRAPLECAAKQINVGEGVAYRCNLVTITDGVMNDFTAGHISTEEADICIQAVHSALGGNGLSFHTGVSYRHAMLAPIEWLEAECTPPHDISDRAVAEFLPKGKNGARLNELMERSQHILKDLPLNKERVDRGDKPVTHIWLWGQGTKPNLPSLRQRFGLQGGVITAVDLIRGIGRLVGLDVIEVPGATGFIDTNYEGKADAALDALRRGNFVYIHVEAPDECGHMGDIALKTKAIQDFDRRLLKRLVEGLDADPSLQPFRLVLLPDHPTPCSLRTHINLPVPTFLFDSRHAGSGRNLKFTEVTVQEVSEVTVPGHELIRLLVQDN